MEVFTMDLKDAFTTCRRDRLFMPLQEVHDQGQETKVKTEGQTSGLAQGSTLSPILFSLVMELAVIRLERDSDEGKEEE